jgi:hypothetical protein
MGQGTAMNTSVRRLLDIVSETETTNDAKKGIPSDPKLPVQIGSS